MPPHLGVNLHYYHSEIIPGFPWPRLPVYGGVI